MLAVAILSIMLSWGKNFLELTDLFFDYFPLYNKFRSVSMIMVLASLVFPLIACLIVDKLLKDAEYIKLNIKKLYIAGAVTGGLCLAFWLIPDLAGDFLKPDGADKGNIEQMVKGSFPPDQADQFMKTGQYTGILTALAEVRATILKGDAIRSFLLIALAFGLIYAFALGKIKREIVLGGIGLLVLFDMFNVDKRYLNDKDFQVKRPITQTIDPTPADVKILQDKSNYRVLNLTVSPFNDASTSYFHKSIGGYHAAKLRRYQDLIDRALSSDIQVKLNANQLDKANALNMLNTKYLITKPEEAGVYPNPFAMGNCWFVSEVLKKETADAEMETVETMDLKSQAVVGKPFLDFVGNKTKFSKEGEIKLIDYKPGIAKYQSNTPSEQFAVFSEVYYNPNVNSDWKQNDWQVTVDGKPAEHIRVNYTLRGMFVPAGNHTIEFKFMPQSYDKGENISFVATTIMILLTCGAGFIIYKNRRREEEDSE